MTKLKPCSDCGTEISPRAKVCPHCGLKKPHEPKVIRAIGDIGNALMALGLLAILVPMLGFCVFSAM